MAHDTGQTTGTMDPGTVEEPQQTATGDVTETTGDGTEDGDIGPETVE